ncbi:MULTISPECIES: hypothetical protein [unclassified Butyrivibrio]|uniref:hypothetical protein n=1 Tax=unclassified Butyrivibrio TaxID=2639466 RepID=UPI0003B5D6B0|nr:MULTISPECIES: hypothetical protein [unclassified Butyrivibrio]SEL70054.1 hypothetical protein SAMN04487770_11556 [Butyrivibrio sp. ob235]
MDILKINSLINIAKDDLQDDPQFKHYHDLLDQERAILNDLGYDPEKMVNILYEIWCQRLGYILDNEASLTKRFSDALAEIQDFPFPLDEDK